MPYKSQAQRRYFHAAEARGDIPKKVVREFDKDSKGKDLPEHIEEKAMGGFIHALKSKMQKERLKKMWLGGEVEELSQEEKDRLGPNYEERKAYHHLDASGDPHPRHRYVEEPEIIDEEEAKKFSKGGKVLAKDILVKYMPSKPKGY